MRLARLLLSFVLSALFLIPSDAQQSSPPSAPSQTAQRDPQALAILSQAVASSGGLTALTAIQDIKGIGTITYYWAGQDVPGSVSLYGKGLNQFRMDATLPDGVRSLIINGPTGALISQDGQRTKLPYYSIMTGGTLAFPLVRIAAALTDSSTSLSYLGPVSWNNSQALKLHVAPSVDPSLRVDSRLKGLGEFDLYLDPTSNQLVEIAERVWWGGDLTQTYSREILFSNYALLSGLSVPLSISEKFGGQQTWSLSLTSVAFNTGLSDSLFTL
jgi:hypothetical protein